ncbi:MAG: NADH:flavin oxidoreductase, partial [Thermodesulfobacteriota bacterium]
VSTVLGIVAPIMSASTPAHVGVLEQIGTQFVGQAVGHVTIIRPDGKSPFVGMQGIHTDDHISRYRELVQSVHENGARIAMQIAHCGRQTTREAIGIEPMGPSAVKEKSLFVKPREMTEEDIERVIEAFVQAARRVKEADFDAVQIHAAHGYLVNQFLCPHTNVRRDRWGGSLENRMRFVRKIYERCRKQVGDDFPILIKINGTDNMKDGLKKEESAVMAQMMGEMGFDGIEVSCGIMEDGYSMLRGNVPIEVILSEWPMYRSKNPLFRFIMKYFGRKIIKPPPMIQAYNRESARAIKSKVKVPVFLVGGITDPASMEEIVEKGDADYISLCRALIADPAFPEKMRSGSREPSRCIHCNLCGAYMISRPLKCYYGKMIGTNLI